MKRLAAVALMTVILLPGVAFAGSSTDAALGLIMGGTLGNGYDRVMFGTVTDFINFHFWPVFNVADSGVSIGVVALVAGYLLRKPSAA